MIFLFIKSQLTLFDAPVHVAASVRKDGTVVKPHIRIMKVALKKPAQTTLFAEPEKPAAPAKRTKLDAFIQKHGGIQSLGSVLAGMTEGQQQTLFAAMAKLDGSTPEAVANLFAGAADKAPERGTTPDLFAQPEPEPAPVVAEETPAASTPEIVEHVTSKGKTLRGVVRTDLTAEQAKEIDPYTFKKLDGWFIREKHLGVPGQSKKKSTQAPVKSGDDLHDDSVISDASGKQYRVHYMRNDLVVTHPIVDGKAQVSADTTVRFRLSDDIDPTSTERPGPIYLVSRPVAVAAKPIKQSDLAAAASRAPFGVPAGVTKGRRREINQVASEIINSGKELTDADKSVLRQYSGNGGCGDSLNEFYTDPEVASAMWTMLGKLGVTSGTVLEPSCATGVFMHTAPEGFRVTGVEMDPTSAAIAEALHGDRHEVINSSLERYATTSGNKQYSAVIGNAPFGIRGSLIKDHKSELKTAEGYFLDTSLDKTEPGGIVAMIVPTGVMDSRSARAVRQRLLCKGEFLGAVRMPNTAFEHSHTEVTTDIVYFRKRADDVAGALLALDKTKLKHLGVWDDEYLSGAYFEGRGAGSIFGTMEAGWRAKAGIGQDITVSGSMIGVADSVAAWQPDEFKTTSPSVTDILAVCGDDQKLTKRVMAGAVRQDNFEGQSGDTKIEDGVTYILQGKPLRWHRLDEFVQTDAVTDAQQLARDIESAVEGGSSDGLAERVNAYIEAHGNPSKNKNLLIAASQDRVLYRLIGAVSPDGKLSDIVAGRARKIEGSLDTAAQALAAEHEAGTFSVAELAKRMGKDDDEVEDMLFASSAYAYSGDGKWTPMDRYLTGELWGKLDYLRAEIGRGELREGLADKYALQAKRLEETIDPKALEDAEVMINSAFLPLSVLEAYFNESKAKSGNSWVRDRPDVKITYKDAWYTVEGGDHNVQNQLEKYLNRDGVRKDDMHIIDDWNTDFKEWLLSSSYRDQVENLYNRAFRGFVQAEYSDATFTIPGMNTDGLKQYQYSGLRWALAAGKGIIAADVGLGKTVRGLMLARMAKVNGTAKRPTFVVPKSVLANWVAEAEKWFPGSRVLVVGETYTRDKDGNLKSKSDSAAERNRKLHEMSQNDYDFVFISQPAFNDIDLDPIVKGQYVNDDFWAQRGDKKGNEGDKKLRKIREAYEQAIANREFQKRTDAAYWDQLGIDMMIVDEGHGYKNLYAAKNRFGDAPKFLGGQGQSNRAFDMNMKTRYLREHNGGKGVFLLTATPTKNSPLEIYSMLSHVAPEAFERIGIRNSEEFLDRFCTFVSDKVLTTSGTIEDALVTDGFKNLDELREIMRRYIDRKTAADVGLVLPTRNDQMHLIDMSEKQEEVYAGLRQDMIDSAKEKDASGDSHVFSIMDKMGKASMDLELLDENQYAGETSPKYDEAAKHIVDGVKDGGQVVFAESVKSHQKLLEALVKKGVPREQIGIINAAEAESSAKRQNIADAFNAGKLKVVIGNTATMGEGINLQKATTDIHHLDLPWDPASMQQRNGRGLRQGNVNESVRIHTYLSKGSFDGYRYQSMMAKKDWQDMLWNGGDTVENLGRAGKFDRSDLMIMMSADPEAERAKFESDKAAASQRFDTDKRREVAVEFKRIQLMKQSYGALKNKKSDSAERLRFKMEQAKTKLANNKYFTAKDALNSKTDVVLDPESGTAIMAGVGLNIDEKDGSTVKWVVTGVNAVSGDVTMRRWGELGRAGGVMTVPSSKLVGGVKPYQFDSVEESKHVTAKLEEQAAAKMNSLTDWKDVKAMPSSVLEANHELIQRQIKDGAKAYSFNMGHSDVPMVNKETGEIKMAASYEHTRMHDTHDYLLPTDANKERVLDAWVKAERGSKISSEHQSMSRGKSRHTAKREYPEAPFGNRHSNPFTGMLNDMSGESPAWGTDSTMVKQAKTRLETEQMDQIRHAKDISTAVRALFPLATVEGSNEGYGDHSHQAKYSKKALTTLWARARHLGALNTKMVDAMNGAPHRGYAVSNHTDKSVHNALVGMAIASGHRDLAEAMLESSKRHNDDLNNHGDTVRVLGHGYENSKRHLEMMMHHAEKAGIADKKLFDISRDYRLKGPFDVTSGWDSNRRGALILRDVINEQLEIANRKEAA